MRANPHAANVNLDWDEPSKIIRLEIDQERARVLGVSSQDLANFVQSSLAGTRVTACSARATSWSRWCCAARPTSARD